MPFPYSKERFTKVVDEESLDLAKNKLAYTYIT
jgi:hypothetical protein